MAAKMAYLCPQHHILLFAVHSFYSLGLNLSEIFLLVLFLKTLKFNSFSYSIYGHHIFIYTDHIFIAWVYNYHIHLCIRSSFKFGSEGNKEYCCSQQFLQTTSWHYLQTAGIHWVCHLLIYY